MRFSPRPNPQEYVMAQQQKQSVEVVEQRAQVTSQERQDATIDAPQVLDEALLKQIGGGTTTESPGKGW
jgi:hypothetical protein